MQILEQHAVDVVQLHSRRGAAQQEKAGARFERKKRFARLGAPLRDRFARRDPAFDSLCSDFLIGARQGAEEPRHASGKRSGHSRNPVEESSLTLLRQSAQRRRDHGQHRGQRLRVEGRRRL
jgi:hypothetical protein